ISGGVSGILLGVITTFIGGAILIISDKLSGGSGVAGAALASTAGNAVATPAAIAEIDKSIAASATIAMPQIAASTITTAILTPILVNFWVKRLQKKGIDPTIEKGNGQCVK
ncbi:TPA: 2-keto-3-deoxygluconate permease, partial [Salmonella enterica subsp. enterica serovar Napoli]|nr:2-keto-3-deoxygluconate permease [Salmonella enterica subsp. enterica serovar Napoli]